MWWHNKKTQSYSIRYYQKYFPYMMMVIIILVEGWEGVRRDITIDFV
jgi:hypothetical protein